MSHTPSPWFFMEDCIDNNIWANTTLIATVSKDGPFAETEKVADANARLIAAAPELLEALTNLMDQLESVGIAIENNDEGQWHGAEGLSFNRARKAIAKATGEKE